MGKFEKVKSKLQKLRGKFKSDKKINTNNNQNNVSESKVPPDGPRKPRSTANARENCSHH